MGREIKNLADKEIEAKEGEELAELIINELVTRKEKVRDILDEALEAAKSIPGVKRDWGLRDITKPLADNGQRGKALEISKDISDERESVLAIKAIGKSLSEDGKKERARAILNEASKEARNISDEYHKVEVLCRIALNMEKTGQEGKTEDILDETLEIARSIPSARSLGDIAQRISEEGREEKAKEVIDEALEMARNISKEWDRAYNLSKIAIAMAENEEKKSARAILDDALDIANKLSDDDRDCLLRFIIDDLTSNSGKGLEEKALEMARNISEGHDRADTLCWVAVAMAENGQEERALEITRNIYYAFDKPWALTRIAVAMAQKGREKKARNLLQESLEEAKDESYEYTRSRGLSLVGKAMAEVGQEEKALDIARNISREYYRSAALRGIAVTMAERYQSDIHNLSTLIETFVLSANCFVSCFITFFGYFEEVS